MYSDKNAGPLRQKRILITGKGSYIGECFKKYLEKELQRYQADCINTVGLVPGPDDFRGYDAVFNVAGIAHVKETAENRHLYYEINRDLAVHIAQAAKEAGAGQFIQLSSMSVYGKEEGLIRKTDVPDPVSAYGESKLSADEAAVQLESEDFKVAVLRPPLVYGRGCRGNYQMLRSFAVKSPVFPDYRNQRSMIYIGNLCEFVKQVIDKKESGLFFPQNSEYVDTSRMVMEVARRNGNRIRLTHIFNPAIRMLPLKIIKKVFGNLIYERTDTVNRYSFQESIALSERRAGRY